MKCKHDIIVSVCPTFQCNNCCDFCYLGIKRECQCLLSVDGLKVLLDDLCQEFSITGINVFGGEISNLDVEYLEKLKSTVKNFCQYSTFTSNLANQKIYRIFDRISTSLNRSRPDFLYILN